MVEHNKIKYYRIKSGMTQQELADKSKISVRALINYEKNLRTPPLEILLKISESLNIDKLDLINQNSKYYNLFNGVDNNTFQEAIKNIGNDKLDSGSKNNLNLMLDMLTGRDLEDHKYKSTIDELLKDLSEINEFIKNNSDNPVRDLNYVSNKLDKIRFSIMHDIKEIENK